MVENALREISMIHGLTYSAALEVIESARRIDTSVPSTSNDVGCVRQAVDLRTDTNGVPDLGSLERGDMHAMWEVASRATEKPWGIKGRPPLVVGLTAAATYRTAAHALQDHDTGGSCAPTAALTRRARGQIQ